MRSKIYADSELKIVVDFGSNLMFENADVQTMVFLAQKNLGNSVHNLNYIKFEKQDIQNIKKFLVNRSFSFINKKLEKNYNANSNLTFSSSINESVLEKIDKKKNFEFDNKKEVIQGIIGGPDKAFLIKEDELKKFTAKEKEFIKMLHTNTGKFSTLDTDKYIFYISKKNFNEENIKDYPNIFERLTQYKNKLENRR